MTQSSLPTSRPSSGTGAVLLVVAVAHDLRSQEGAPFHHSLRTIYSNMIM